MVHNKVDSSPHCRDTSPPPENWTAQFFINPQRAKQAGGYTKSLHSRLYTLFWQVLFQYAAHLIGLKFGVGSYRAYIWDWIC